MHEYHVPKLFLGLCESFVDVGGAVALPKLRPVAERLVHDLPSLHSFWNHHSYHVSSIICLKSTLLGDWNMIQLAWYYVFPGLRASCRSPRPTSPRSCTRARRGTRRPKRIHGWSVWFSNALYVWLRCSCTDSSIYMYEKNIASLCLRHIIFPVSDTQYILCGNLCQLSNTAVTREKWHAWTQNRRSIIIGEVANHPPEEDQHYLSKNILWRVSEKWVSGEVYPEWDDFIRSHYWWR